MLKMIVRELKEHAPFTLLGALIGMACFLLFRNMPRETAHNLFYVMHPGHVFLSALVTSSMYKIHKCGGFGTCNIWAVLAIGYAGSIGIATLSDSLIPYLGEILLNMPHREAHIGFIEKWWLITPIAIAGIAVAYFKPGTKFPHAGHVLLSTWASLFHMIMAMGNNMPWYSYATVFAFLFISVWLPCCISDIVFPLLFVKNNGDGSERKP